MKKIIIISALLLMHNLSHTSMVPAKPSETIGTIRQGVLSQAISALAIDIKKYENKLDESLSESSSFQNIKQFLDHNPSSVDDYDADGNTLLMHSVMHYSPSMHQLICSYNPNVNAQNKYQQTALHLAIIYGQYATFKAVVDLQPDLSLMNENNETVYMNGLRHVTGFSNKLKIVPFRSAQFWALIDEKICVERMLRLIPNNTITKEDTPNPQELVRAGQIIDIIHQIKKYPAHEVTPLSREWNSYCSAIYKIRNFLAQAPENINAIEPIFDGNTLFMYAAQSPNTPLRKYCYGLNPNIHALNKRKQTALHLAMLEACPQAFKELIDHGVDQAIVDDEGNTAKMVGQKKISRISQFMISIGSHKGEFQSSRLSKKSMLNELAQEKAYVEQKLSYLK